MMVERLTAVGAAAIGFDVVFEEPRDAAGDRRFAQALAAAGNVVLLQWLKKDTQSVDMGRDRANDTVFIEQLRSPTAQLAGAAAALAPFPLPKVPAKVKQVWLFKGGAGDVPTLPTVMFQLYALDHYESLVSLIRRVDVDLLPELPDTRDEALSEGRLQDLVRAIRMRFRGDPALGRRLIAVLDEQPESQHAAAYMTLRSLIHMYDGRDDPYVNFYGPARTVTTLPYHEAMAASDESLSRRVRGKAVFVGISEDAQPRQRDGFYTPFTSETTGLDISGVEIAATTFANLLEMSPVRQLGTGALLGMIFVCGMIVGLASRLFATPVAVGGALALGIGYSLSVYLGFARAGTWYPFAIPLLLQIPVALLAAFVWRYIDSNREQQKIRRAFEHYLPPAIVEQVARDITSITGENREMYGICLYTDVEKFTSLSERVAPAELGMLMNRYFETMIRPVREHGGMVSNLAGDAMLATWASDTAEPGNRRLACTAALAIREAVEQLNETLGEHKLPTRIGLHAGQLLLGNIGAMDHYEYSVLGDMVNTAARIQAASTARLLCVNW
jgi:adenylate cyclase